MGEQALRQTAPRAPPPTTALLVGQPSHGKGNVRTTCRQLRLRPKEAPLAATRSELAQGGSPTAARLSGSESEAWTGSVRSCGMGTSAGGCVRSGATADRGSGVGGTVGQLHVSRPAPATPLSWRPRRSSALSWTGCRPPARGCSAGRPRCMPSSSRTRRPAARRAEHVVHTEGLARKGGRRAFIHRLVFRTGAPTRPASRTTRSAPSLARTPPNRRRQHVSLLTAAGGWQLCARAPGKAILISSNLRTAPRLGRQSLGTKLSAGRHVPGPTRQLRTQGISCDGTEGRQHRWGGALGRGAAPDSQDGGRAAGKLAGAPGVQRDGRPRGGALSRRSYRLFRARMRIVRRQKNVRAGGLRGRSGPVKQSFLRALQRAPPRGGCSARAPGHEAVRNHASNAGCAVSRAYSADAGVNGSPRLYPAKPLGLLFLISQRPEKGSEAQPAGKGK